MDADFVTRFAPSPTGHLHLGHAYSALVAHDAARTAGGRFLLRIEDIDQGRCRPVFETAILEVLAWLGLAWEEPVRRQSDHFADYAKALETLRDKGVVYRCFKTRKEVIDEIARAPHQAPNGPDGPAYIGKPLTKLEETSRLEDGAPFAWRLSMASAREMMGGAFDNLTWVEEPLTTPNLSAQDKTAEIHAARPEIFGDPVIARKDNGASYHLASVTDDALQGVSHVIRGEDLREAAHLHRLLQALLDLPPVTYRFHKLITDENGKRLAKRDKAATIKAMREGGATPDDIRDCLKS